MCNNTTESVVRIMGGVSKPFIVNNGLRQGNAFSSVLFKKLKILLVN